MQPTDTALSVAEWHPDGEIEADPASSDLAALSKANNAPSSRTDAHTLRQAAALARMAAATLATVTAVTARTDGAATLQALRQAAGDCSGYAESMESEAAA